MGTDARQADEDVQTLLVFRSFLLRWVSYVYLHQTHNRKLSENLRALYKDFNQYQGKLRRVWSEVVLTLFPDAIELVKPKVLSNNGHLSTDDRTALAFAYKQMLKGLRDQLDSTTQPGGAQTTSVLTNEISRVCNEVIDLLRQWLIPAATAGEESVFYWKMSVHHSSCLAAC